MGYRLDFGALLQYLSLFLQGTAVTVGPPALPPPPRLPPRPPPSIVHMFSVSFGLPSRAAGRGGGGAAVLAMTITLTAYAIEIVRAGIEAVPKGQSETGLALGLRPWLVFGFIVLPQALANV